MRLSLLITMIPSLPILISKAEVSSEMSLSNVDTFKFSPKISSVSIDVRSSLAKAVKVLSTDSL